MARHIGADGRPVYRAVITLGEDPRPRYEGPYDSIGTARARIAFWRTYLARSGSTATGHVEQGHTLWTPLNEHANAPAADPIAILRALVTAPDAPRHCHTNPPQWDGGGPCTYCTALAQAVDLLATQEQQP